MYPNLLGFEDSSYIFFITLGIIIAFFVLVIYLKRKSLTKNQILDITVCGLFAIAFGIIFAVLFQNLYDLIKNPSHYKFSFSMTFYGGLFGGVFGFLLLYFLYYKRHNPGIIDKMLIVAPGCITAAHGFGRIGCFFAGCCYGKHTDSWIGIYFPSLGDKVIPTQLFEAIFLFILSGILINLAFKKDFKYTFLIYLSSYGVFRFIIEFFRGDEYRGSTFLGMYPSQIWCLLIIVCIFPLYILIKRIFTKN